MIGGEYKYDWITENMPKKEPQKLDGLSGVRIHDETLRDGLQGSYISRYPEWREKGSILNIDSQLGIDSVNLGFPASSSAQKSDVKRLVKYASNHSLGMGLTCATRALPKDLDHIADCMEFAGCSIEAGMFISSSDIGMGAVRTDLVKTLEMVKQAITHAVKRQIPVMFVAEDSTRTYPNVLKQIYSAAIDYGASRICIADTVGIMDPEGIAKMKYFLEEEVTKYNNIPIDWHGHNDLGQALSNALYAIRCGFSRVHATWLGIGERSGNVPLDQLLVVLAERGVDVNISNFKGLGREYIPYISSVLGHKIPDNYPIFGEAVFTTSTGTHAWKIEEAQLRGLHELAAITYSPINPDMIGREIKIEVGPNSGKGNVRLKLDKMGLGVTNEAVEAIFNRAKQSNHTLTDSEIRLIYNQNKITLNNDSD